VEEERRWHYEREDFMTGEELISKIKE